MKLISEVKGKTNEKQFVTRERNEEEEPRNNRYSEFFVATVRFGPRSLMTLELIPFNHLSHKKYQQVLSFVPIPGKLTPVSQPVDMFIVSLITLKGSTLIERAIISMGLRDFGVT
jgi:hypothetical protein